MKIANIVTFVIALGMLFTSCNENENLVEIPRSEVGEGYMSVILEDAQGLTRSSGEDHGTEDERAIKNLEFYVFDAAGNHDSEKGYFKFTPSSSQQYTFGVPAQQGVQVLVAANLELGALSGNLTEIRKTLHDVAFTNPLEFSVADGIPMSGEKSGIHIEEEEIKTVNISLNRLYSKLSAPTTVGVQVEITDTEEVKKLGELLEDIQGEVGFHLNSYIVVNGLTKSFAFPNYGTSEASRWDPQVWTLGNLHSNYTASEYNNEGGLGKVYSGSGFLENGESVFVYENSPLRITENSVTGYDAKTIYALIIEAELYDTAVPANSVTRYWRINVSKTDDKESIYKILRNAIYNVNIQRVTTVGYGTPKEAEEEKPIIPDVNESGILAKITVAPWRIFTEDRDI